MTKIPVKFNPTEATAYNLSMETLGEIVGKLTDEQKAFVDEMQNYLSATMGEKGNEVSLELYGIKLFNEEFILLDVYPRSGGTVNVTYGGLTKTIADIDHYETYCDDHPKYENNRAVCAIANIKRVYAERMAKHDFQ